VAIPNHSIGRAAGCDRVARQRISHDSIIDLGIDRAPIQGDPGAAVPARLDGFTKAFNDVGLSRVVLVLQGHNMFGPTLRPY